MSQDWYPLTTRVFSKIFEYFSNFLKNVPDFLKLFTLSLQSGKDILPFSYFFQDFSELFNFSEAYTTPSVSHRPESSPAYLPTVSHHFGVFVPTVPEILISLRRRKMDELRCRIRRTRVWKTSTRGKSRAAWRRDLERKKIGVILSRGGGLGCDYIFPGDKRLIWEGAGRRRANEIQFFGSVEKYEIFNAVFGGKRDPVFWGFCGKI